MSRLLVTLLVAVLICSCQKQITNSFTQISERERFITEKSRFVDSNFNFLPDSNNEKSFQSAFWATELMLRKSKSDSSNLSYALAHFDDYSVRFKQSLLQHIFTLYPFAFKSHVDSLLQLESDNKRFALMANYLIRMDSSKLDMIKSLMNKKFLNWSENPIMKAFSESHTNFNELTKSQIADLIAFRSNSKEASFFVFVHKNRDIPGYLIVQNKYGKILTEKGDTLKFRVLARSITNMPEYISNGNTPQGVYSIQGFSVSDNVFIGKSPTIISTLPFETSLAEFSLGKMNGDWTLEKYNQFYPGSWKNYLPKNMSFYA